MIQRLPRIDGFDWDAGNVSKCEEHGLTLLMIERLFDRVLLVAPDPFAHEIRHRAVGFTESGRPVFVVFTMRERDGRMLLRPISARFMHKREFDAVKEAIPEIRD